MLGWFADLFRLAVGLIYWNARKSWFQARRGRSPCPCQSPSDSGKAYETVCEACVSWNRQGRFRRVCPLLVETPQGLRCSANTEDVRPFWNRALAYYGGTLFAIYGAGALAVFLFLRTVGYPISIVHVALPPLWHRVTEARGWFFLERSNRAFAEGRTSEGLLYLANSYEFDPQNYNAGLSLAKNLQIGQPAQSDKIYGQLMHEHPDKRHFTAQEWFRAQLARGSFDKIAALARDELLSDPEHAAVWIRALLFASSQTGKDAVLRDLARSEKPEARVWRQLLTTELLLRSGRKAEARAVLEGPWPPPTTPQTSFCLFYRVNTLTEMGAAFAAVDLLAKYPNALDREAEVTLKLEAYSALNSAKLLKAQVDELLSPRFTVTNLSIIKIVCAQLIRKPDGALFERLWAKVEREKLPMTGETAGAWFSLLCTAGAVGDKPRLHEITARLKQASKSPFIALGLVEAFFRGETNERRITVFLPILPVPLEVTYALLERYRPPPVVAVTLPKRP